MQSVPWEKLEKVFEAVAEVIRKGGEHFWPLVVRQQFINGSFDLLLAIGVVPSGWRMFKWCRNKAKEDTYNDTEWSVAAGAVVFVMVIAVLILLFYAISMLFNPEWWALVALTNLVK